MKTQTPQWSGWVRGAATLMSIPLTLGLSPVVGAVLGLLLDRWLGTKPVFTVLGLLAGFVSGIRETIILLKRATEDEKRNTPKSDSHK